MKTNLLRFTAVAGGDSPFVWCVSCLGAGKYESDAQDIY